MKTGEQGVNNILEVVVEFCLTFAAAGANTICEGVEEKVELIEIGLVPISLLLEFESDFLKNL